MEHIDLDNPWSNIPDGLAEAVSDLPPERARIIPNISAGIAQGLSRNRNGSYRGVPVDQKLEHVQAQSIRILAQNSPESDIAEAMSIVSASFSSAEPVPAASGLDKAVDSILERIIGDDDMLPITWLHKALRAADAVARVRTKFADEEAKSASGFMISPDLFMTNHHVLGLRDVAAYEAAVLTFGFQEGPDGNEQAFEHVRLDPARFYCADETLDFAITAVRQPEGDKIGTKYGCLPLRAAPRKALAGAALNILQHPNGHPKRIAMRNNLMTDMSDRGLAVYLTDTNPGSSGAPVLNDDFEVVALHCRGREFVDEHGNKIDLNGQPVTASTPEAARYFVANEGSRISAIVERLRSVADTLSPEQRLLLDAAII